MNAWLFSFLALVISVSAFADISSPVPAEKSVFDLSAPHMAEFLVESITTNRVERIESALTVLERERPVKTRYNVINEGGLLKVEESTPSPDDKASL